MLGNPMWEAFQMKRTSSQKTFRVTYPKEQKKSFIDVIHTRVNKVKNAFLDHAHTIKQ